MQKFNFTIGLFSLFLLLLPSQCLSFELPDQTALAAAEYFLERLDHGESQSAWAQTSHINLNYTQQPEWFAKAVAVRPFLGPLLDRTLKTSSQHHTWTGYPDGDYLRISYTSNFSNKRNSLETVVLIREGNTWNVTSYYLK